MTQKRKKQNVNCEVAYMQQRLIFCSRNKESHRNLIQEQMMDISVVVSHLLIYQLDIKAVMGCLPSTSAQEFTEEAEFQVLLTFLRNNESVFQDCYLGMNQRFKRPAFQFMEISDCQNLVDSVLLAQFLGDCLWSYSPSPNRIEDLKSLLPLLKTKNTLAYEILRILRYLCNESLPEEVKRTGWLERVQERSLPRDPLEEDALYVGGYKFACHFLASAILGKKSDFGAGFIQELLRIYMETHLSDAVTAILVYWAKFPQEFMPLSFTQTAIVEMSHEQFQLYLEIAAFYPTTASPIEEICSRFEAVEMSIPRRLASYLVDSSRLLAFLAYFRKRPGPLLKKALSFVLQALKSISEKEETAFDTLTAVLRVLDLETLPHDIVLDCEEQFKELFDLQFMHCRVDIPFSDAYLRHTARTSQNNTEIAKKVRERVFYAAIDTVDQGKRLESLVDYLDTILQDSSSACFNEKTTDLMARCIELFPPIVEPLLKSATSTMEILIQTQATAKEDLPTLTNTIKSVEKLILKMKSQSAPETLAPPELMTMIERYTKCILPEDRSMPDRPILKAIAKECRRQSKELNHLMLSQTDYDGDSKFTNIVWCLMSRHAKKLSKGLPQRWQGSVFRQKWQNHAFLVQEFSRFALFQLLFQTDQDLLLRRTILAFFICDFQKKKEIEHNQNLRDRLLSEKLTVIRLALSNHFQVPSIDGQLNMIETVLTSMCLHTALTAAGVAVNRNLYLSYKGKIFFADLGSDTFGLTIFGGYILLNQEYLEKDLLGQCVLMITLSHELAHSERRFNQNGTVNVEANSPLKDIVAFGTPGKPISEDKIGREGGFILESKLFGVRVTSLSQSQIDFLTKRESWSMNLNEFRGTLESLGRSARPIDIYTLGRHNNQLYFLPPRRSCYARG